MIPHSRPELSDSEIEAVAAALRAGRLSQGEEVAALEADLSGMLGADAVVVSSGTAALYLALVALGVEGKHKVGIPSFTCNSLYAAVSHTGATPVCADVKPGGLCVARETIEPIMRDEIKAAIVPHTCGYLADVEGISGLGLPVIEDCAQAAGGRYPDGSPVGSKGDIAVLSFFATKLLPAGEGGACITRNPDVSKRIRQLRSCDERPLDPRAFNFKMADMNAALARARLRNLSAAVEERGRIARSYDRAFGERSFRNKSTQTQAVCFRYIVETRSEVETFLDKARAAGIICRRPVWRPLHHFLGGHCPRTEALENRLASVPIYPGLTKAEIKEICKKLPEML